MPRACRSGTSSVRSCVLPKQTTKRTRGIDGSFRFPKPWGKQWGSQGLTDDGEKRV